MNALAALNRARAAWERSQPQLFIELWPDALDEPALSPSPSPGAGSSSAAALTSGAEPCREAPGLTANQPVAVSPAWSGGSAPHLTTTPRAAQPPKVNAARGRGGEST